MESAWRVPSSIYDAMARAAERDYPRETCGLVFGDDASLEVVAMENIQDRLHAEDPAAHPRDARTAYQFDSLSFDRVLKEREQQGRPLRAIYHSHPEHDAYFSRKDREDAAPPDWGPLFPDAVYIVFSVRGRRVVDVKGFAWSPAVEDYVEVTIQREDSA